MHLGAGGCDQGRGLDLPVATPGEEGAGGGDQRRAAIEERQSGGKTLGDQAGIAGRSGFR